MNGATHSPLDEPDVKISLIRLSGRFPTAGRGIARTAGFAVRVICLATVATVTHSDARSKPRRQEETRTTNAVVHATGSAHISIDGLAAHQRQAQFAFLPGTSNPNHNLFIARQ